MFFFSPLLDLIFPPRCVFCGTGGAIICPTCARAIRPAISPYQKVRDYPDLDGVIIACEPSPPLRKAIHAFKYNTYRAAADLLATHLSAPLQKIRFEEGSVVAPVPLHWSRKMWRGFNQAAVLGKTITRQNNLPFSTSLLKRQRKTSSQMKLNRTARLKNLQGAFVSPADLQGKTILLVDDVLTTGATLGECARTLKKAGAKKVIGVVLCRGV